MPVREDILTPIPGDNPSGSNLRHAPIYDQVKEARRQEDAGPQGDWEREIKSADYKAVVQLAQEAIAKQSKDLQLAVWLTEALTYQEQAAGLCAGLALCRDLINSFWDSLYPELEEADAEFRATPLEWLGNYFDPSKGSSPAVAVRRIPITRSGHDWFQYKISRTVPAEADAQGNESKAEARRVALSEGKLAPEEFDTRLSRNSQGVLSPAGIRFQDCQRKPGSAGRRLQGKVRRRSARLSGTRAGARRGFDFGPHPPAGETETGSRSGGAFRNFSRGRGLDLPDAALEEGLEIADGATGSLELRTRQDALRLLIASARFLRRSAPSDPVPYLMVRALRWGELRGADGDIAGSLLEAPPAEIRVKLKTSAVAGDWSRVLEIAEGAAAGGCGRGWLDLHRYTIRACDELGFTGVARALRSSLKALLSDLPRLPMMTLADDTGTANPETMEWLVRESLFTPGAAEDTSGQ